MSNIFKVNKKDKRTTSGVSVANFALISHFILLLILLNSNKCQFSLRNYRFRQSCFQSCGKYIDLWTGEICWAKNVHPYSPSLGMQKDNFSQQRFKKISPTLTLFDTIFQMAKKIKKG